MCTNATDKKRYKCVRCSDIHMCQSCYRCVALDSYCNNLTYSTTAKRMIYTLVMRSSPYRTWKYQSLSEFTLLRRSNVRKILKLTESYSLICLQHFCIAV